MSWWGGAQPGDWVRTKRDIQLTMTDRLLGKGGLARGTKGVVTAARGMRHEIEFDTGLGRVCATVSSRDVEVIRRGGGVGQFRTRGNRLAMVRLGLAVALCLPVIQFVLLFWWGNDRSFSGMTQAFIQAVLYGAEDSLIAAIHEPKKAAFYFLVLALLTRFTFGRRAR